MTAPEARRNMEARIFGKIIGFWELKEPIKMPNGNIIKSYPKKLYGKITDVDRTMIEFTDTMGEIHLFKGSNVRMFRPVGMMSMKLPRKHLKNIYNKHC